MLLSEHFFTYAAPVVVHFQTNNWKTWDTTLLIIKCDERPEGVGEEVSYRSASCLAKLAIRPSNGLSSHPLFLLRKSSQ